MLNITNQLLLPAAFDEVKELYNEIGVDIYSIIIINKDVVIRYNNLKSGWAQYHPKAKSYSRVNQEILLKALRIILSSKDDKYTRTYNPKTKVVKIIVNDLNY